MFLAIWQPQRYFYSRVYSSCLAQAMEQAGYVVTMNLDGGDADADFYYLSHSNYFIASAGGYSRIIGEMVTRLGGTVIGRTFYDADAVQFFEQYGTYQSKVKGKLPQQSQKTKK